MKNIKSKFKVLFLLPLLSFISFACFTTPYQPHGFRGGYSETRLDDNIFLVYFYGKNPNEVGRVIDYNLLRSAELAYENGYEYFIIINNLRKHAINVTYTTPAQTQTELSIYENEAYGSTVVYNGQTYLLAKPCGFNTIVCFKEKPGGSVYEAKLLINSIRAMYDL